MTIPHHIFPLPEVYPHDVTRNLVASNPFATIALARVYVERCVDAGITRLLDCGFPDEKWADLVSDDLAGVLAAAVKWHVVGSGDRTLSRSTVDRLITTIEERVEGTAAASLVRAAGGERNGIVQRVEPLLAAGADVMARSRASLTVDVDEEYCDFGAEGVVTLRDISPLVAMANVMDAGQISSVLGAHTAILPLRSLPVVSQSDDRQDLDLIQSAVVLRSQALFNTALTLLDSSSPEIRAGLADDAAWALDQWAAKPRSHGDAMGWVLGMLAHGGDLAARPDLLRRTWNGERLLTLIAAEGGIQDEGALVLRQCLELGAEVDGRNARGDTPLMVAVRNNHLAAARVLVAFGADVEAFHADRHSPLALALTSDAPEMAALLRSAQSLRAAREAISESRPGRAPSPK